MKPAYPPFPRPLLARTVEDEARYRAEYVDALFAGSRLEALAKGSPGRGLSQSGYDTLRRNMDKCRAKGARRC